MPQWDFLDFLERQGARHPGFDLRMRTAADGLIQEGGRTVGVRATDAEGPLEIRADLIVGAAGGHATVPQGSRLAVRQLGAPMDALWSSPPHQPTDPGDTVGVFDA